MKKGQFSTEQIIGILQQAESGDKPIKDVCRLHGITETTFYRWRRTYADLSVPEAQRLKELERENARLKRLLAERDLEVDALREFLTKK
jgi:putative transposase